MCPKSCPDKVSPVCASDGKTYSSKCFLQQVSCKSASTILVVLHDGICHSNKISTPASIDLNSDCSGCPQKGLERKKVEYAAQFAALSLTSHRNEVHYLALDSIRKVEIKVILIL